MLHIFFWIFQSSFRFKSLFFGFWYRCTSRVVWKFWRPAKNFSLYTVVSWFDVSLTFLCQRWFHRLIRLWASETTAVHAHLTYAALLSPCSAPALTLDASAYKLCLHLQKLHKCLFTCLCSCALALLTSARCAGLWQLSATCCSLLENLTSTFLQGLQLQRYKALPSCRELFDRVQVFSNSSLIEL